MWLFDTRSNKPDNIAAYYLDVVEEYGGCPDDRVTDLRTENGTVAAKQSHTNSAIFQIQLATWHKQSSFLGLLSFDLIFFAQLRDS